MVEQPLTGTETRFAAEAGTSVARFTGNGRDWVLRWIPNASRRIHPAEECYRAAGWRVHPLPMRFFIPSDGSFASARWGCFEAQRGTSAAEVCQTSIDGNDRSWSDVGSWWWAAIFRRTPAPWLGIEMITALPKSRSSDEVQSGTGACLPLMFGARDRGRRVEYVLFAVTSSTRRLRVSGYRYQLGPLSEAPGLLESTGFSR
jgi:hypothetical protein